MHDRPAGSPTDIDPPGDRASDAESTHSSDHAGQTYSGLNGLMSQAMDLPAPNRALTLPVVSGSAASGVII
jgi:hypothetical protein